MISFFRAPIKNTTPQAQVSVLQIYKYITSENAKLATERLRSIADRGEARRYKAEMFDYVTFSGCFSTRQNAGLLEHSGFLCFDIDKIETEEQLQNIKAQLITDEKLHTVLLFRSPSGNGLKWVVEVPDRYWLRQCQQSTVNIFRYAQDFCSAQQSEQAQLPSLIAKSQQTTDDRVQITDITPSASLVPLKQGDNIISHGKSFSLTEFTEFFHIRSKTFGSRKFTPTECLSCTKDSSVIDVVVRNHKLLYERIRHYLLDEYGIVTDHTSDIARPCYLCYDDDAYYDEPTFKANPASEFLIEGQQTTVNGLCRSDDRKDTACRVPTRGSNSETEELVREIERRRIDITSDYSNWIRIAFAIASKHGVSGEEYFHRISQFNSGYDSDETHKVYQSCLRNNNGAVTIGTVVFLMRNEE